MVDADGRKTTTWARPWATTWATVPSGRLVRAAVLAAGLPLALATVVPAATARPVHGQARDSAAGPPAEIGDTIETGDTEAPDHATRGPTTPPTLRLGAAGEDLAVDGALDDAAWQSAEVATGFVQRVPDEGEPATQRTEVRMLHRGDAIYVGVRLLDTDPASIRSRMARRDQDVVADWFYVYLDSYDDRRTAFGFGVSAAGVERDLRLSDDTREDASWDAVWESEARIGPEGWTVEMRIPLSQLRFSGAEAGDGWGVNFRRVIARSNEESYWAPRPREANRFVSLFGRLQGVDELESSRAVEVIPYTVSRLTSAPVHERDPFHSPTEATGSVGADVRVGLGRGLTLTATLNPDFGQVEADPATVNLTAFETFQRERRPFFVEGSDIFDLSTPMGPPFFYSRRIGRRPRGFAPGGAEFSDVPRASTILGAAKLTGKTEGGWSVGLMEAVTGREEVRWIDGQGVEAAREAEPLTTHTVGRVVRELRGGRTGIGLLATATNRRITDPSLEHLHDAAYGVALDGWHRFADDAWELRWGLLGSHVRGDSAAVLRTQRSAGHYFQRPGAGHLHLDPGRTSLSGSSANLLLQKRSGNWRTGVQAQVTTPGYEIADFGFNPTLDHVQTNTWLRYEDFSPGSLFRSWNLGSSVMTQSTTGGELKELTADLGFDFTLLDYWGGGVWLMRHRPAWEPGALRGGPALRKPGRWMGNVRVRSDRRKAVSGDAFLFWEVEDQDAGHRLSLNGSVDVRPSDRLSLSLGTSATTRRKAWQWVGRPTVDGAGVPVLGTIEQTSVSVPLRLDYAFTSDLTLQLFARPFLAGGAYDDFKEVADPAATAFDERFRTYGEEAVERVEKDGSVRYAVDRDGDGAADFSLRDPDFNSRSLQVNAVLRWQYRPGSTLFFVWTQDRSAFDRRGFELGRDFGRLFDAPGRDIFMIKASWWLGL